MVKEIRYAPLRDYFPSFDRLIRSIKALNYWDRRVFLANHVSAKHPRFLYKYRKLAETPADIQHEYLADFVVENRLYMSSPRDFNDPFDMTAQARLGNSRIAIRKKFEAIAKRNGLSFKERKKSVDNIMAKSNAEILETVTHAHEQLAASAGVFSLSSDPRSVLMWGHYGGDHTGACLQFEVARGPEVFLEALLVSYVRDYPSYDWTIEDAGAQLIETLTHKFIDWKYENEWRLVHQNGARAYRSFPPESLRSIILGCRTSEKQVALLEALLEERRRRSHPEIIVYKAEKHQSKYAINIRKN
jgi:hypothetical protein